ncbi:MAG: fasciclin domain-containing protein [Bacteroidota bacterium]
MKFAYLLIGSILVVSLSTSCKDDAKNKEETTTTEEAVNSEEKEAEEEEYLEQVIANSVLAKLMVTPEAKAYAQKTLNASLTDMLSKDAGPFTLLVPSNEAFGNLPEAKKTELARVDQLEALGTLLKNHMVAGEFSTATLTQTVKRNGTHTLKTIGGADLMVYLEGTNIMVKDKNGVAATIGKSDIMADNGIVHIIDSVLVID